MDCCNHKCLYTSQAIPNLSIKPSYPFLPYCHPSLTKANKTMPITFVTAFVHLLCLCPLLSSLSKLFLVGGFCWWSPGECWSFLGAHLAVAVCLQLQPAVCLSEHMVRGGSASTGQMLKHKHVELVVFSLLWAFCDYRTPPMCSAVVFFSGDYS